MATGSTAAAFLHRTSRAGDPQLHTHVLVANLIQGSDGRWSALDGRLVYAHARTAGFLYQAALRARAHSQPRRRGGGRSTRASAEIDGVRAGCCGRSRGGARRSRRRWRATAPAAGTQPRSRRSQPGGRRIATCDAEQLVPEWRHARALGVSTQARIARSARPQPVIEAPDWAAAFEQLAGSDGLTRDRSSFGRRDVLQALCAAAGQGATVERDRARRRRVPAVAERGALARRRRATSRRGTRRPSSSRLNAASSTRRRAARCRARARRVRTRRSAALSRDRSSPASSARWCAGSRRTATASRRRRPRRHRQDDRARRRARGVGAVGHAGPRLCARPRAARELEHDRGHASRRASRRCSASVAPLARGTVLDRRRGRHARHPRSRPAARARDAAQRQARRSPATPASCRRSAPAARSARCATRLDPIELRDNRRQREAWEREAVELLRNRDGERALDALRTPRPTPHRPPRRRGRPAACSPTGTPTATPTAA